jgi:hypothetical protein
VSLGRFSNDVKVCLGFYNVFLLSGKISAKEEKGKKYFRRTYWPSLEGGNIGNIDLTQEEGNILFGQNNLCSVSFVFSY